MGITLSGRKSSIKGISDVVGLLINTIPLRVKTNEESNISDILTNVKKDLIDINENSDLSLSEIKSVCDLNMKNQLFDSLVVVENYPLDIKAISDGKTLKVNSYSMVEKTNFDLTLEIALFTGIKIKYSFDSFKRKSQRFGI